MRLGCLARNCRPVFASQRVIQPTTTQLARLPLLGSFFCHGKPAVRSICFAAKISWLAAKGLFIWREEIWT